MHKLSNYCRDLLMRQVEEEEDQETAAANAGSSSRRPLKSGEVMSGGKFVQDSLKVEQDAGAKKIKATLDVQRQELLTSLMKEEYSVAAREEDFQEALGGRRPTSGNLSVKRKHDQDESGGGGTTPKHRSEKKQRR